MSQQKIFQAISDERKYQDMVWGDVEQHPLTQGEWLLVLEAELAEAKAAWVKNGERPHSVLDEVRQVAAVAVACMEQHGYWPRAGMNFKIPQVVTAEMEESFPAMFDVEGERKTQVRYETQEEKVQERKLSNADLKVVVGLLHQEFVRLVEKEKHLVYIDPQYKESLQRIQEWAQKELYARGDL